MSRCLVLDTSLSFIIRRYVIPTMDANCNALGPLELTWRRPRPAVCSAQLRASLTTVSLVSTVTTCLVASRTSISIWFILTMGVSNRGTRGELKDQYEVTSPGQDSLSSCFTFRSYECVRVLLDARANVNQQVGKLKAPLWTSLTSRHVFLPFVIRECWSFCPTYKVKTWYIPSRLCRGEENLSF